jgi:ParB family chromosome partitioning protein
MNAITTTEAKAVHTTASSAANVLQAADPSKHMILVPLSRLVLSPTGRNVRKTTPRMSIPQLAASIQRVGLLQNLIVIPAADGLHYEVVAGGRRLAALKLLAKKHRIAKDWQVPCLQVADGTARTASLTENVQREAMHPADQFEAFAALVAEGRPIEDIAADFSVTPLVVQRRLKLANVSPRLIDDYRADAVTLDQLMALAITDDHAAQEAAFYDAPQWQRNPSALRERLTEREIGASHPLVRFVGLDACEAAGGGIRRDLFAEGDAGVYVSDTAMLETLVREKLTGMADTIRAEGWAWVDSTPAMTHADLQGSVSGELRLFARDTEQLSWSHQLLRGRGSERGSCPEHSGRREVSALYAQEESPCIRPARLSQGSAGSLPVVLRRARLPEGTVASSLDVGECIKIHRRPGSRGDSPQERAICAF